MSRQYYQNINPSLLAWIPVNAKRILEVGCGEATLAAAFKSANPDAHITAIEIDRDAAAIARGRVDTILEENFETMSSDEIDNLGCFDTIIMGDVLEHFANPSHILKKVRTLLSDDGCFVACVPNVAHWTALAELFQGNWPLANNGLFDRTHLKFFTLKSLSNLLHQEGFKVLKTRTRNFLLDEKTAQTVIPVLADAAERVGLNRQEFINRATAIQYVVVACKNSADFSLLPHLHISAMAPRFLDVRTKLPADGLASLPDMIVTHAEKTLELPRVHSSQPKICVLQRLSIANPEAYLKWLNDRSQEGWIFVAESDDHPALLATVHGRDPAAESWLPITASHAVQTSTTALANVYKQHNPEVACFANSVFDLPKIRDKSGSPKIFLGALNRERITSAVAASLNEFCDKYPDVEFIVVHDRIFFDALKTQNKTFHAATGYSDYIRILGECNISLMPLEGTFGETFKSDIKFLEASSQGVVSIASPTVYSGSIINGKTGFIVHNLEDWAGIIERIILDDTLRDQVSRNAWEYVKNERMFHLQAEARRRWYLNLWSRRDELHKHLIARHPEIGQH